MKRIISIIVLTAMFTAIAVGLAGCGVKTTLRSGNDPIIGKWKCNEAYDESFDWLGRVYYGLDIDASGWGIIERTLLFRFSGRQGFLRLLQLRQLFQQVKSHWLNRW